jgi:hypothetical protein
MTALINIIDQFKSFGVQLQVQGTNIKYFIPKPVKQAHPEIDILLSELKAHKAEAIQILSQQKKTWVEPELKPVRALMLWSEILHDYFWWVIDKSVLPEIQKDGIPIYDSAEIDIMLNAQDDKERQKLHSFKKMFGATIHKANNVRR